MKYFQENISESEWMSNMEEYWRNFNEIDSNFPSKFNDAYRKGGFHDSNLVKVSLIQKCMKTYSRYDVLIYLQDYFDENIMHEITFKNISVYKNSFDLETDEFNKSSDTFVWLYSEIIKVSDGIFSLEATLTDGAHLYIEFKKISYKKMKVK